ncbi:transporter [Parvularcula dongshanensis]|uniref:Transporter n=1 Tax=Parvularcula dongshanensis TaxID=1173995 RepID=A0A840HZ55_9PROT|nr:transporter [Parvularcula dongshanensis]MBB4658126.1 hypothetical protein [Parvularcula dongshanensis]
MTRLVLLVLAAALAALGPAAGQDPLSADRPGFATGTDTVGAGTVQIEAGLEWAPSDDVAALPLALLRYGAGEGTEVRVSWTGVTTGDGGTALEGGTIEVKQALSEGDGLRPALSLLGVVAIGAEDGAARPLDPSVGLLWSSDLTDTLNLSGTVTVGSVTVGDERRTEWTNAVGLGFALSRRAGLFVEHYVSVLEGTEDDTHYVDGGVTYLLSDDLQLDLTGGVSVGAADAGAFVGGGVAYRF